MLLNLNLYQCCNSTCYWTILIQPAIERYSDLFELSEKILYFRLVDQPDIEKFIGILYLQAASRVNLLNREFIGNHESPDDVITATMSKNRFRFISQFVTFDDKPNLTARRLSSLLVWGNFLKQWMRETQKWGIHLLC